tara:strand:+ start:463 stop:2481 length:2019 start_codon:yes stop_codon:yes gene_type:complete
MSNILEIILTGDTKQLDAALSKTQKKLKDFGDSAKAVGKSMSIYVTAPIVLAGGASIKFASDFQESLNKVDVSFKNSSKEVREFAKTTLKSFGIAEGTALDMSALFGDMSTSMGLSTNEAAKMSTSLVGLAGDMASFKNISIDEVTTALSSVFTGETESLKRLGIVMTEVNLKQFAMEQGITKNIKLFSQAEKVQLRYNYVMAQTANSQGDFARTSDGAANQMRIFQETIKELAVEFGQILLPTFTKIITKVNDLLERFRELSPSTKKIIIVVAGLAAALGPLLIVIGTLASTVIPALITGFKLFKTAMIAVTGPIGLIITAVTALAGLVVHLGKKIAPSVSAIDILKESFLGLATGTVSARLAMAQFNEEQLKAAKIAANLLGGVAPTGPNLPGQGPKKDNASFGLGLLAPNVKTKAAVATTEDDLKDLTPTLDRVGTIAGEDAAEGRGVLFKKLFEGFETKNGLKFGGKIDTQPLIKSTTEALNKLKATLAPKFDETISYMFDLGPSISNAISGMAEAIGSGTMSLGQILGGLLAMLGDVIVQIGKTAIQAGIGMEAIRNAFKNPFTAIAAGIALVAFGSFIKSKASSIGQQQTAFANGGIVSGPVNALVGEYPGAKSNPEVIAPLNKLKNIIGDQNGGGNVNVTGEFVVRGQDLVVALQRADKTRSRIK